MKIHNTLQIVFEMKLTMIIKFNIGTQLLLQENQLVMLGHRTVGASINNNYSTEEV